MSSEAPPLDPQIAPQAARFDEVMGQPGLTVQQFRERYSALMAEQGEPPVRVRTSDITIATRHGDMGARLYTPEITAPPALILYMHGGGFMVGSLDGLDKVMHQFSHATGLAILSLDYALAPEHTYPVALQQCEDALLWAAENTELLGTSGNIAVAGDSAGGNLSALLAIRHHAELGERLFWQGLINPVLDFPGVAEGRKLSHRQFAAGPILNIEVMKGFNQAYFPDKESLVEASPIHFKGDMNGLPSAFIAAAECDPLRDDSVHYAAMLQAAGVPATLKVYPGMCHNYMTLAHHSKVAAGFIEDFIAEARTAAATLA